MRNADHSPHGSLGDALCVAAIVAAGVAGYAMLAHLWMNCGWPYR